MNSSADASVPYVGVSFDRFIASLRDPDDPAPIVSARRFGEALHIDLQTLAQQAHVHRNTISRQPASESVQRFLRDALRVIRAASDLAGDVSKALFWYRNEPLPVFDYKTAEQLVSDGRADDVLRFVASLEAGAAG
ncbi:MbcA/ParS/Xre antitoxin family protein [Caballeronia sp. AZ10_KS36]|uniref:MbcA/ParS/Xre antitoxin family protein n=1 Tax=Caballeronia sp. AZ10_KS36 TaxID=2921757 RepID=UPI002028A3B9|nr:MbcA/ParS/Xre antitoxin family protein [Caballeronia sp. AZ10_KS36]